LRSVALYTVYTVSEKKIFENDKSMENMADTDTHFNIQGEYKLSEDFVTP